MKGQEIYRCIGLMIAICVWLCGNDSVDGQHIAQRTGVDTQIGIVSSHPVLQAANLIQQVYAKPVTYESPLQLFVGDMRVRGKGMDFKWGMYPKDLHLSMSSWFNPDDRQSLTETLVSKMLDTYHSENKTAPHFRLLKSRLGFHIIPDQVTDVSGRRVVSMNPLDVQVRVSVQKRLPSEHLEALCAEISKAIGTKVQPNGQWLDQYFAPNGMLVPPRVSGGDADRYGFEWGITMASAREALMGLIDLSATTLTWRFMFVPSAQPEDRMWVLNVLPIEVFITGRDGMRHTQVLQFDRCTLCPPLKKRW
jgi:hypothetical protein